jgi:hypothetical protein
MKHRYRRRELILALERNTAELASFRCEMQALGKRLDALRRVLREG